MSDLNWNDRIDSTMQELADEFETELNSFQVVDNGGQTLTPQQGETNTFKVEETQKVETVKETQPAPEQVIVAPKQEEHIQVQQPVEAPQERKVNPRDFLNNMKFDLNAIEIVDASPMEEIDNFEFVLNNKGKTQIVANQSNYIAYMEALNYNEISALTNSTLDDFSSQVLLAQTIHSKINTTSLGRVPYEKWTEITSYYDLDTFLYGIYLQTFPGDTKFNITCGSCKNRVEAVVNNDTLITAKGDSTYENLNEVLNNRDVKSVLGKALVNVTHRILLPDSKTIMDIKLPTVKRHLDLIGAVNKNVKDKTSHIISMMIFINKTLMVDVKKSMATGKPCYYEINDREKLAKLIAKLSFEDAKALSKAIEDMVAKNAVEYKIKSFKCPKCNKELGDIPVEMETLLFYQILQL